MSDVYEIVFKIFGIYSLTLTICGSVFDLAGVYICNKIKNNSTFTFYKFGNLASMLGLFYWNLSYFNSAFGLDPNFFDTIWLCRIGHFIQFSSLQITSWIHVVYWFIIISLSHIFLSYLNWFKGNDKLG